MWRRQATIVWLGLPGEGDMRCRRCAAYSRHQHPVCVLAPLVWPTAIKAVAAGIIDTDKIFTHEFSLKMRKKASYYEDRPCDKLVYVIG